MNRKLFLLIVLSINSFCVQAQNYQSLFGNTSTSWIFSWGNLFGTTKDSLYVVKDTTVNSIAYKKVLTTYPTFYPGGLLREELDSGKVFYRELYSAKLNNYLDTAERVLFRYDLAKGDVFDDRTVDSVDTINGLKYLYLSNSGQEPITIIEGVGLDVGLLGTRKSSTAMQGQYLLCSYKDGVKTSYTNILYNGDCDPPLAVKDRETLASKISFAPNPASQSIQITNHTGKLLDKVTITGLDGRLYKTIAQIPATGITIEELPQGYYFIHFILEGFQLTKPLIIQ